MRYDEIYSNIYAQSGGFAEFLVDAADDTGNQVLNCFGFDWCGETFSTPAAAAGCDPDDDRAQDSSCWKDVGPGAERPVWLQGGPAVCLRGLLPGLSLGLRRGTATLQGTVTDNGAASEAFVLVDGLGAMDISSPDGSYQIEAAPNGFWTELAVDLVPGLSLV